MENKSRGFNFPASPFQGYHGMTDVMLARFRLKCMVARQPKPNSPRNPKTNRTFQWR